MSGTAAAGVEGLDHTGVVVTDLNAAVDFFVRWLGAREVFRLDRTDDPTGQSSARLGAPPAASFALAMLEVGGGRLELLQWWTTGGASSESDGSSAPPPVHAPAAAHVAMRVEGVDDALSRLRHVPDVEVLGEPLTFTSGPTPGLRNAFVRTSWGALIELVSWGSHPSDKVT